MAVSRLACPVIKITATCGSTRRDFSSTSRPPRPGITMSVTMTSNSCSSMQLNASSPLPAVATRYPVAASASLSIACMSGSSSTTRIEAVMAPPGRVDSGSTGRTAHVESPPPTVSVLIRPSWCPKVWTPTNAFRQCLEMEKASASIPKDTEEDTPSKACERRLIAALGSARARSERLTVAPSAFRHKKFWRAAFSDLRPPPPPRSNG